MFSKIRLDQSFFLTGKWALPDSDLFCQGSLAYDEDKLELKLLGGFASSAESKLEVDKKFERYQLVYGQSNEHGKCTLMKGAVNLLRSPRPVNLEIRHYYPHQNAFGR
ncbi:MAG: hypothetical protein AAGA30_03085 [Planctomycetota bacterium]